MRIEKFKAIEGMASNVRQARAAWGNSYECLFYLSDTPVALRVNRPVFIENGETVKVVGRRNWNGAFEALAYYTRSSGASGNSDQALGKGEYDKLMATICLFGMTVAVVGLITGSLFIRTLADLLFVVCAFFGLLLVIGLRMFLRYRSEIRTIAK